MAWYDGGAGAGTWSGIALNPSLKNILHQLADAIGLRQIYRAASPITVTSITRSGTTATVTTTGDHGLNTGAKVHIFGCDQTQYNGIQTITVTGNTTFTFQVSGSPATPATGSPACRRPATKFTYNADGDQKYFPSTADFEGMPISHLGTGPERNVFNTFTPSSVTFSGGVVTVTTSSANVSALTIGDPIDVSGADQAPYNGAQVVLGKPTATTFTYAIAGSPASPATGTIEVRRHGSITRNGSVVTVHLPGHGLPIGGKVELSGATQSEYNGEQTVTGFPSFPNVSSIVRSGSTATVTLLGGHGLIAGDLVLVTQCLEAEYNGLKTVVLTPTSDTFTFSVTGTPATPASGSPTCRDLSRFTFTISETPATPASGNIKATCARHMVPLASYSGGTGTFHCYDHGFSVGDYVEIVPAKSGFTDWSTYAAITAKTTHTFQISMANPTNDDFEYNSSGTMHVVREGVFRRLLREMQAAIGGLITASTSNGTIRFVEDSSPYTTNYTLANLLGAGSHGSSWLSLNALLRTDLGAVIEQMREALDLLVVMTVVNSASADSSDVYSSWFDGTPGWYSILSGTATRDGDYIEMTFSESHLLDVGETIILDHTGVTFTPHFRREVTVDTVPTNSSIEFEDTDYEEDDTFPAGSNYTNRLSYPAVSKINAWANATGGSPKTTSASNGLSQRRIDSIFTEIVSVLGVPIADVIQNFAAILPYGSASFTFTKTVGAFVDGCVRLAQSHTGDAAQDSYTVTDSDADTIDMDCSLGVSSEVVEVQKPSTFFDADSQDLEYDTPIPGSHPFSGSFSTTESEFSERALSAVGSRHTRELVPGTHLTYG